MCQVSLGYKFDSHAFFQWFRSIQPFDSYFGATPTNQANLIFFSIQAYLLKVLFSLSLSLDCFRYMHLLAGEKNATIINHRPLKIFHMNHERSVYLQSKYLLKLKEKRKIHHHNMFCFDFLPIIRSFFEIINQSLNLSSNLINFKIT